MDKHMKGLASSPVQTATTHFAHVPGYSFFLFEKWKTRCHDRNVFVESAQTQQFTNMNDGKMKKKKKKKKQKSH